MMSKGNRPFLTVILPVYNGEAYLRQGLGSVLSQGVDDLEVLAVDDGSSDQSLEMLRQMAGEDARLNVLTQANAGPSAARNLGIDKAQGEYLYFMDCDDFLEPGVLPGLIALCREHRPDLLAFGYQKDFEKQGEIIGVKRYRGALQTAKTPEELSGLLPSLLENRLHAYLWNKFYRRDFVGETRFEDNIRLHEDALFNFELYRRMSSMVVSDVIGYHYMQRESDSLVKRFPRERPAWMGRTMEELAGLFRQYGVWDSCGQMVYQSVLDHTILCVRAAIASRNGLTKPEQTGMIREILSLPVVREGLSNLAKQPAKRELIRRVLKTGNPALVRWFFRQV